MNQNRQPIFDALEALIAGAYPWKVTSQRLKLPNEVTQEQMPAAFLYSPAETIARQGERLPMATTLKFDVYIYLASGFDPNTTPADEINTVLDALDRAFKANTDPITESCTLGGLVSHCWIEGELEKVPGDIGELSLAIVPVRVLVP